MRASIIQAARLSLLMQKVISSSRAGAASAKGRFTSSEILQIDVLRERAVPGVALVLSSVCMILGCCCLISESLDIPAAIFLSLQSLSLLSLYFYIYRIDEKWDRKFLILVILSFASAVTLWAIPEYFHNPLGLTAIFHRSVVSSLLLLGVSIPSVCISLNYFLGVTPQSHDTSRYPLLIIPILLAIAVFTLFIINVVSKGAPNLTWEGITTPYQNTHWQQMVYENGWPVWIDQSIEQAGLRNYILGTLLLMGLTCLLSLPIGVGVGVYLSEYSHRAFSSLIRFSTNALRAISVVILGLVALSMVKYSVGTPVSDLFAGYFYDVNGAKHVAGGSFFTAAIFISLLVIPIIARCTEEGLRSLPHELREGSLALGASQGHTLTRILLPWSTPNIMTGLLLGCAEAAGALAVIMFISGVGDGGLQPLGETTSLSYMIFHASFGPKSFHEAMIPYQWTAALIILIMALGLSIAGVVLKQRFSKRYRGA